MLLNSPPSPHSPSGSNRAQGLPLTSNATSAVDSNPPWPRGAGATNPDLCPKPQPNKRTPAMATQNASANQQPQAATLVIARPPSPGHSASGPWPCAHPIGSHPARASLVQTCTGRSESHGRLYGGASGQAAQGWIGALALAQHILGGGLGHWPLCAPVQGWIGALASECSNPGVDCGIGLCVRQYRCGHQFLWAMYGPRK